MARRLSLMAGGLLLASTFAFNVSAASPWEPLAPGDGVSFLIPQFAGQPVGTTGAVIFSGGQLSEIAIAGCGLGTRSVQHYVLVDLTGAKSEKLEGIVAVTTLPVQPSTRLGSLTFDSTCLIGGVLYFRYDGVVE
jgi:hypothetical protein